MSYFATTFSSFFTLEVLRNPQGAPSQVVASPVVWSSTEHTAHVNVSGVSATTADAADWSRAKAAPAQSSGKRYFEATGVYAPYAASDGSMTLALVTASWDATDAVSSPGVAFDGGKAFEYNPLGDINDYAAVDYVATSHAWASGETTRWAVDFGAGKAWVGNATGWYGDPAAGTGEAFTFTPGTALTPAFTLYSNGTDEASVTLDTGATAFAYAVPAGFSAWDATTA